MKLTACIASACALVGETQDRGPAQNFTVGKRWRRYREGQGAAPRLRSTLSERVARAEVGCAFRKEAEHA